MASEQTPLGVKIVFVGGESPLPTHRDALVLAGDAVGRAEVREGKILAIHGPETALRAHMSLLVRLVDRLVWLREAWLDKLGVPRDVSERPRFFAALLPKNAADALWTMGHYDLSLLLDQYMPYLCNLAAQDALDTAFQLAKVAARATAPLRPFVFVLTRL